MRQNQSYLLGHGGDLLQVASSTGGDLSFTKHNLLCSTATQGSHNAGKDLLLGDEGGIVVGNEPGEATGLATGYQGHLLDGIMARGEGSAGRRKKEMKRGTSVVMTRGARN